MGKFIAVTLGLIFGALAVVAIYGVITFTTSPSSSDEAIIVDVPPGSSFASVSRDLEKHGLIRDQLFFKIYARALNYTKSLHIGEYELRMNMSPAEILKVLSTGKSISYPVTIPEGYNIFEISTVIGQKWPEKAKEFLELVRDKEVVKNTLGIEANSLEGYLFPDTYYVTKYMTANEIIRMMFKQFESAYSQMPKTNLTSKFTRHQIVTLASVIEKETGAPEERPLISSVFHNRLNKGMRLQSDPTIIYGIWVQTGEYLKNIRRSHITGPTPYNTYTVKALPAGPIANPGFDALKAVVSPAKSEYFYFVSRNDGTHVFSKTYEEHNQAVKDFQLNSDARKGKSWRDLNQQSTTD